MHHEERLLRRAVALLPAALAAALAVAIATGGGACRRQFGTVCGDGFCGPGESAAGCAADCAGPPICGNGTCDPTETIDSCAEDCAAYCGNGTCDAGESSATCPTDCDAGCGNGACEPALGESCVCCEADCGFCPGDEDTSAACGDGTDNDLDGLDDCADPDCAPYCGSCSDGTCGDGETCGNCPTDCGMCCGDGSCNAAGGESCATCPADCGGCCGNGLCEPTLGETCSLCPSDCGPCCGNSACEPGLGESCTSCPFDCGSCCGNGLCEAALGETCATCAFDCGGEAVDQSHTYSDTTVGTAPEYYGQSFTASMTGNLTRIDVLGILDTGGFGLVTVEVYTGGVCGITPCGTIVRSEAHSFALGDNYFTLYSPLPVFAGSTYTWRLYTSYGISGTTDGAGLYSGGQSLFSATYDLNFVTWVDPCP